MFFVQKFVSQVEHRNLQEKAEHRHHVQRLNEEVDALKNQLEQEQAATRLAREQHEAAVQESIKLRDQLVAKEEEIQSRDTTLTKKDSEIALLESQIIEHETGLEKALKEIDIQQAEFQRSREEANAAFESKLEEMRQSYIRRTHMYSTSTVVWFFVFWFCL